jgi:hypothetical protein
MKKKFILFLGTGWSGTTSLYYTLKNKVNYLHGGWCKEPSYLVRIFKEITKIPARYDLNAFNLLMGAFNSINIIEKDPILSRFTEKDIYKCFGHFVTLDNYVEHYVKLSEYCEGTYEAVADFSNMNYFLKENMYHQIYSALSKYFDVKVIVIFRDFIRREWSMTCALSNYNQDHFIPYYDLNSNVADIIKRKKPLNYAQKIKEVSNIFGKDNVCYLIMEDFFNNINNNPEVVKLENFLNIKISEVHPCAFVPDCGINAPKLSDLKDQWISDHEILTDEFYNYIRNRKDYIQSYSDFEELHGFLPANWGVPIDYGY